MRYQGTNSNGEVISSAYVEHDQVDVVLEGPSLTRQEFAEECDINVLMAKYETTGTLNHFNSGQPQYMDLTEMPENLQDTLALVKDAEAAFMRLPALVRREFDNNALDFVDFASDPYNMQQLREWGLARPAEPVDALEPSTPTQQAARKDPPPEAS